LNKNNNLLYKERP